MVGMTVALSVAPGLAEAELGEYQVGYISQDGMRHQVSLAAARHALTAVCQRTHAALEVLCS
jgi:hypothetical protein